MNIGVHLFEVVFWISSDEYPQVELLGHKVILFFILLGTTILFSIAAALICNPTNSTLEFSFLYILTNICQTNNLLPSFSLFFSILCSFTCFNPYYFLSYIVFGFCLPFCCSFLKLEVRVLI